MKWQSVTKSSDIHKATMLSCVKRFYPAAHILWLPIRTAWPDSHLTDGVKVIPTQMIIPEEDALGFNASTGDLINSLCLPVGVVRRLTRYSWWQDKCFEDLGNLLEFSYSRVVNLPLGTDAVPVKQAKHFWASLPTPAAPHRYECWTGPSRSNRTLHYWWCWLKWSRRHPLPKPVRVQEPA